MLGNIDIERLNKARRNLQDMKDSKMALVARKHIRDRYRIWDLVDHWREETLELEKALNDDFSRSKLEKALEEIADVSGMLDLLFMECFERVFPEKSS